MWRRRDWGCRSLPAPVPVILPAPTRRPPRLRPLTRQATTVDLPAFIDVPSTAMTRARIPSLQHGRAFTVERIGKLVEPAQ